MKSLLSILLVIIVTNISTAQNADAGFEAYKNRFVEEFWRLNPGWALSNGYNRYADILEIPSKENIKKERQDYIKLEAELDKIDKNRLTVNNRTDYTLIKNLFESNKWYEEVFKSYEWNPASYNVGGGMDLVLKLNDRSIDEKVRAISARLKNVPAYYAAAKENITIPTKEHTELAIIQNQGSLSILKKDIPDSVKSSTLSEDEKNYIISLNDFAVRAIEDYIEFLNSLLLKDQPPVFRSFRIGKEMFARKFELDTRSGYTAEQIYRKAIDHKKELHAKMTEVSRQLWQKYFGNASPPSDDLVMIKKVIDTISAVHVKREELLDAVRKQIPELTDFVKKHNLLFLDPSKPLVVRETPLYARGSGAGASINAPGPYDKNGNTYYNVTPLDNYSPEQAESWLREYNKYMLQILNIHEAIPGHYAQLVYRNKSPSIIKSILGNGTMVEGWAVYAERMMLEEGYGNNEPEMWLMYYKWNLRSTINTIIDYSIHSLDMQKEDVIRMLINEGFQQEAEASGKWKRASLSSVQLCTYFTGYTEIYDFREEYKKQLESRFNLKAFHEDFLSYGSVPVKYIKELMTAKK
jgi:uncharacterized protein (DUF885 family)